MECISDYSRPVKYWPVLCLVLATVHYSETQSTSYLTEGGLGVALPMLKEGQNQGQSAVSSLSDHTFHSSHRPNLTPPFVVKFDDDSIVRPSHPVVRGQPPPMAELGQTKVAGALQHIRDPDGDPIIRSLLGHPAVLKKIQQETTSDSAVKVHSVITAHKQVVSGLITYLDIKVVRTTCAVGTKNLAGCEVDTKEEPYICEVAVWQRAWLNSTKVIDDKTRCAEVEESNDFKNWNRGNNVLRERHNEISLRVLPSYLDEKQVALEAFDYIDRGSESKFKGQMVNYQIGSIRHDSILNITTVDVKVEYGFTLCLKFPNKKVDSRICPLDIERENYVCSITVISDPNLTTNLKVVPDNEDDDIECEKRQSVEEELVVPVQVVCMGCPQAISLNDPSALHVAEFAVMEYDRQSDDKELHVLLKLNKAHTQAVNGVTYYLTLEIGETDCHKPLSAFNMNRTLCNLAPGEEKEICEMVVLEKPWQKSRELLSSKCFDQDDYSSSHKDEFIVPVVAPSRPQFSPGFVASPTRVHSLTGVQSSGSASVKFVLEEFNRREVNDDDDGLYKVLTVLQSTTTNDRSGEVDHLILELGETICTRRHVSTNCPLKLGEDVEICSASVLKGNPRRLLWLRCDDKDDHYRLTSNPVISPYQPVGRPFFALHPEASNAPGSLNKHPVNSPAVLDMANFIVSQYNLQSDDDELYKLSKVISAFSLDKANSVFMIELELLETECKKYQPVVDVSQCPVEPREEAEVCQAEISVSAQSPETKHLRRIFCDEQRTFYVKKMSEIHRSTAASPSDKWKTEAITSKLKSFGELIADEFDARSDDDNIFVLVKVLEAKAEPTGLTHLLKVELGETVCPKYKQGINKTRCVIDIGEEPKICDARVAEQPWKNDVVIQTLRCFERDESLEDDESAEVYYPRVHPSAHARPKFPQSRFRIRQHSRESDESNEKFYSFAEARRHVPRYDSDEDRFAHPTVLIDDDDADSDHHHENDSRSLEHFSRHHFRFRRFSPVQNAARSPVRLTRSLPVEHNKGKLMDIATLASKRWISTPRISH